MFSPRMMFRLPGGGDMSMDYKPWTNWGEVSASAGAPQIEDEIFRYEALPGKQLGRLMDAVSALIDVVAHEHPQSYATHQAAFAELKDIALTITLKKEDLKKTAKTEAVRALDLLQRSDTEAFRDVIQRYRQSTEATKDT
jgi:hypothetical protein